MLLKLSFRYIVAISPYRNLPQATETASLFSTDGLRVDLLSHNPVEE